MERARATWTDERLDDLSKRMDAGFDRVDRELRSTRVELGGRIDALQRTMLQVGGGIIASILVAIVSLIAAQG